MNNNKVLSFCIPTYNNELSVNRLVLSILEHNGDDIGITVLDNGSTDNTLSTLGDIKDSRLEIYSNGVNKGALYNMINVLDKGNGTYLVYCTDHDHVDASKIENFLSFLKSNRFISCGYCEYESHNNQSSKIFEPGFSSVSQLGHITRHPTGFYFKREFWHSLNCTQRFSDFDFVNLFPLEFVFAELSVVGSGSVYHDNLFKPERGGRVVKHKSSTTDGKSKKAFFSPETRLKLAISFEKHIRSLNIADKYKKKLRISSFFRELSSATFGYRTVLKNVNICEHYYMETRVVGIGEMMKLAKDFYRGYNQNVIHKINSSFIGRNYFRLLLIINIVPTLSKKLVGRS